MTVKADDDGSQLLVLRLELAAAVPVVLGVHIGEEEVGDALLATLPLSSGMVCTLDVRHTSSVVRVDATYSASISTYSVLCSSLPLYLWISHQAY